MGKRENKIEVYLREQLEYLFLGSFTRKWVSPGHTGVMDQICFINPVWFVEVKTEDGIQSPHQAREAQRLIEAGERVAIVYGHPGVDSFCKWLRTTPFTKCERHLKQLEFR